jgi:type IV secretory pathway VirB2 component (pilin)
MTIGMVPGGWGRALKWLVGAMLVLVAVEVILKLLGQA